MKLYRDRRRNPRAVHFEDEDSWGYDAVIEFVGQPDGKMARMNDKWRDATARAWVGNELVDEVEYSKIGPMTTLPVIPYLGRTGPMHLSYEEYVSPSSSPWRAIKQFATNYDLWPRVGGKRFPARLCQASDDLDWHARCRYYHDLLTWRTYWAVELLLKLLGKHGRAISGSQLLTKWQKSLEDPAFHKAEMPQYVESAVLGLFANPSPYDQPVFFELVRKIPSFHQQRPEDVTLDYSAPYKKPR